MIQNGHTSKEENHRILLPKYLLRVAICIHFNKTPVSEWYKVFSLNHRNSKDKTTSYTKKNHNSKTDNESESVTTTNRKPSGFKVGNVINN